MLSAHNVLFRLYPYECFLAKEGKHAVEDILSKLQLLPALKEEKLRMGVTEVISDGESTKVISLGSTIQIKVRLYELFFLYSFSGKSAMS